MVFEMHFLSSLSLCYGRMGHFNAGMEEKKIENALGPIPSLAE
jgi:hypothetical protein